MRRHAAFMVPVGDRWLVYAPLQPLAAVVNGPAARRLAGGGEAGWGDTARLRESLERPPARVPNRPQGDISPYLLGILPTRSCNLACRYCDFGGSPTPGARLTPALGAAAVDWMAARLRAAARSDFRVHFFGGEPFLAPDVVETVVHRVRHLASRDAELSPYIDGSTNGVMDDGMCEFVGDYFNGIAVSLDGPAAIHDRQRPAAGNRPTFDVVRRTALRLREAPVDLCLRACVTSTSVHRLEDTVCWMIDTFQPAEIDAEPLTPGPRAKATGLAAPDPYVFASQFARAARAAEAAGVRLVYAAADIDRSRLSFCPVGSDAVIVSPDGRLNACYVQPAAWRARGLDLDLGFIRADGEVVIDRSALDRVRRLPDTKPRCRGCFCQWTCAGGCHVHETYPGSAGGYTPFCAQTRVLTAWHLLRELQCHDLADALTADRSAMSRLSHHSWDPIDVVSEEPGVPAGVPADVPRRGGVGAVSSAGQRSQGAAG